MSKASLPPRWAEKPAVANPASERPRARPRPPFARAASEAAASATLARFSEPCSVATRRSRPVRCVQSDSPAAAVGSAAATAIASAGSADRALAGERVPTRSRMTLAVQAPMGTSVRTGWSGARSQRPSRRLRRRSERPRIAETRGCATSASRSSQGASTRRSARVTCAKPRRVARRPRAAGADAKPIGMSSSASTCQALPLAATQPKPVPSSAAQAEGQRSGQRGWRRSRAHHDGSRPELTAARSRILVEDPVGGPETGRGLEEIVRAVRSTGRSSCCAEIPVSASLRSTTPARRHSQDGFHRRPSHEELTPGWRRPHDRLRATSVGRSEAPASDATASASGPS